MSFYCFIEVHKSSNEEFVHLDCPNNPIGSNEIAQKWQNLIIQYISYFIIVLNSQFCYSTSNTWSTKTFVFIWSVELLVKLIRYIEKFVFRLNDT